MKKLIFFFLIATLSCPFGGLAVENKAIPEHRAGPGIPLERKAERQTIPQQRTPPASPREAPLAGENPAQTLNILNLTEPAAKVFE